MYILLAKGHMHRERGIQSRHEDRGVEQGPLRYEGGGGRKVTKYILLDYNRNGVPQSMLITGSQSKPKQKELTVHSSASCVLNVSIFYNYVHSVTVFGVLYRMCSI